MPEELRQAVLGAGNIQSPASPLGASQGPELAALFQSTYQLPQATGAVSAGANIAAEQVAAAKRAAAEAKARADDLSDPKKYRRVRKADGGFDFFAPDGSQVDIATLTQRTGTRPLDWIDDSDNPIDKNYIANWKNLNDYMNAVTNQEATKIAVIKAKAKKNGRDLSKYEDEGGVDRLVRDFRQAYRRYYDPSSWGVKPSTRTFIPSSEL